MIWVEASTFGETLLISGTWFLMAIASARTRVRVPWVPVRTPLTARPPSSIHTKLSPRLFSCCSTRACPALPIATTQITAAMPMVIPSTVSELRSLFLSSAPQADPSRAESMSLRRGSIATRFEVRQPRTEGGRAKAGAQPRDGGPAPPAPRSVASLGSAQPAHDGFPAHHDRHRAACAGAHRAAILRDRQAQPQLDAPARARDRHGLVERHRAAVERRREPQAPEPPWDADADDAVRRHHTAVMPRSGRRHGWLMPIDSRLSFTLGVLLTEGAMYPGGGVAAGCGRKSSGLPRSLTMTNISVPVTMSMRSPPRLSSVVSETLVPGTPTTSTDWSSSSKSSVPRKLVENLMLDVSPTTSACTTGRARRSPVGT